MQTSTKRILSITLAGLLFIGALMIYANLIEPEIRKIGEMRAEVFSKEQAFNGHKKAVEKVQALIAKVRGEAQLQETVNMALPSNPDVTRVLGQIYAISRSSQADLTLFTVKELPFKADESNLVKRVGVLEVNLGVSGTYESIKNFMKALETNIRVSDVKSFHVGVEGSSSRASQNFFTGSAVVNVYYQEQ